MFDTLLVMTLFLLASLFVCLLKDLASISKVCLFHSFPMDINRYFVISTLLFILTPSLLNLRKYTSNSI